MPFIDLPLVVIYYEWRMMPGLGCFGIFATTSLMCILSTGIAEAIMFLRVYALSKRKKSVAIYLSVHFGLVQAATVALYIVFANSLKFQDPLPGFPIHIGCIPMEAKVNHLSTIFALVIVNQCVITALSFYFVLTNFKRSRGPLIDLLFEDGVFYFVVMSGITIANFVLSLTMPPDLQFVLSGIQRALHATIASRITIGMREYAQKDLHLSTPSISKMRFEKFSTFDESRGMTTGDLGRAAGYLGTMNGTMSGMSTAQTATSRSGGVSSGFASDNEMGGDGDGRVQGMQAQSMDQSRGSITLERRK
ncbi:hypothetical protein CC2G_005149 [Coprinopsis cinerea AmutBmut pab1-1]|nr:hypothetical protein CC2G_005149 [Coprinopsis cinerea AmutBmut pab1-1]